MANPQGTGFINLGRILQSNQNNRLGQQIGSRLSGEKSALDDERNRQKEEFNKSVTTTQSKLQQDKNQQQQLLNEADTSPGTVDPEDAKKYESFRNYVYTGPQGLGGASELDAGAQNYQQTVDLGLTRGGRQELISRYSTPRGYNNPSYNRLDELYLGNKDLQNLKGARTGANQLQQQNVQAVQGAKGQAAQQEAQSQQFRTDANQQVDARKQALLDMLNQRATQFGTTQEQEYQNLLGGGAFQQAQPLVKDASPTDISTTLNLATSGQTIDPVLGNQLGLGLSKSINEYNFGVGPDSFVNRGSTANASTVADPNERAKSSALASLAGVTNPIDTNAGQYQGAGANSAGYAQSINNALGQYKSDLANTQFPALPAVNPYGAVPGDSLGKVLQKAAYRYQLSKQMYDRDKGGPLAGNSLNAYLSSQKNYQDLLNNPLVKQIQSRYNLS